MGENSIKLSTAMSAVMKNPMKRLILIFLDIPITETFTPLESPSNYAGDGGSVPYSCLPAGREGGVKAPPF